VLGAVLYDTVGIIGAYSTQVSAYGAALIALAVLGLWWRHIHTREPLTNLAADQGVQAAAAGDALSSADAPAGGRVGEAVSRPSTAQHHHALTGVVTGHYKCSTPDQAVQLVADTPKATDAAPPPAPAWTGAPDIAAAAEHRLDDTTSDHRSTQQHSVLAMVSAS
jgi:hypothetical protein